MPEPHTEDSPIRVLALCTFPEEAAATRFRVGQYVRPLAERGVEINIRPFLSAEQFRSLYAGSGVVSKVAGTARSIAKRAVELASSSKYDLLFVQREAMPFGPGIFERLFQTFGTLPMVLDLDDATYVRYVSPTYGRLGSALKFFSKTDKLIDRSEMVICGNRYIAEYAERRGGQSIIIPTVADTDLFKPIENENETPVIGWIGTHSTFPFLEKLFPTLQQLARKHKFILRIVGSGRKDVSLDGIVVENLEWSISREVSDFQNLDIGLYPITVSESASEDWLAGKSGFKAVQYMAVGVPFVMSPVGVCGEMGDTGKTHFNADGGEDWYNHLDTLLSNRELRIEMGSQGRQYALDHFLLEKHAEVLANALKSVVETGRG